jgi:hypothetical protein
MNGLSQHVVIFNEEQIHACLLACKLQGSQPF